MKLHSWALALVGLVASPAVVPQPAASQAKRISSHVFAIAPNWQASIPANKRQVCTTRVNLGSTIVASGRITRFHTGLETQNDMVIAANSAGDWELYISPAKAAADGNCLYPVIAGTGLKWQDLPKLGKAPRVSARLNSTDGMQPYKPENCALLARALQAEALSLRTSRVLVPDRCRSYYDIYSQSLKFERASTLVMNGYGKSANGGSRLFSFFVNVEGWFTLYETDGALDTIVLLNGDDFRYAPAIENQYAIRRAELARRGQAFAAEKAARDQAAQKAAALARSRQAEQKRAAAARLAAYEADLAKRGLVNITYGQIRFGVTPISDAVRLFAQYTQAPMRREASAGRLVRYCGNYSCIFESGGKAVAMTLSFGGANNIGAFNRAMYDLRDQGFTQVQWHNDDKKMSDIYRKKQYVLTNRQYLSYTEKDYTTLSGYNTGVRVRSDESFSGLVCLYPANLASQLDARDRCAA